MPNDGPELSAIQTSLGEVAERVLAVAERAAADPDDQMSVGLFEVDRSLRNAMRQLERVRNRIA